MSIGYRISKERKRRGLSQKRLSQMADISVSYLNDIEHDRSQPSISRLKDLAIALNVRLSFLIDDDYVREDEDVFCVIGSGTEKLLCELMRNERFVEILREFETFDSWSEGEAEELLGFLRAKNRYKELAGSNT